MCPRKQLAFGYAALFRSRHGLELGAAPPVVGTVPRYPSLTTPNTGSGSTAAALVGSKRRWLRVCSPPCFPLCRREHTDRLRLLGL